MLYGKFCLNVYSDTPICHCSSSQNITFVKKFVILNRVTDYFYQGKGQPCTVLTSESWVWTLISQQPRLMVMFVSMVRDYLLKTALSQPQNALLPPGGAHRECVYKTHRAVRLRTLIAPVAEKHQTKQLLPRQSSNKPLTGHHEQYFILVTESRSCVKP